jgi:hypothetical protein
MKAQYVLSDDTHISRTTGLVASEVNGEVVILSIDSGHFFQLNAIGSRIWDILEAPRTLGEICSAMCGQFDVEAEACRTDVFAFVQQMRDKGLLEGN